MAEKKYDWGKVWLEFYSDEECHSVLKFFKVRYGVDMGTNWNIKKNTVWWAEKKKLQMNMSYNNMLWKIQSQKEKRWEKIINNVTAARELAHSTNAEATFKFLEELRQKNAQNPWKITKAIQWILTNITMLEELHKEETKKGEINVNYNVEASPEVAKAVNERMNKWENLDDVYKDVFWINQF